MVEPTHLQNMLVKLDHHPRDRGENKHYLKPPARKFLGAFVGALRNNRDGVRKLKKAPINWQISWELLALWFFRPLK